MAATGLFSVYVGHLDHTITKSDLIGLFERYGTPKRIFIADRDSKTSEFTYAFVRFVRKESAIKAILELDGKVLKGKPVRVEFSDDNPMREEISREIKNRKNNVQTEETSRKMSDDVQRLIKLKVAIRDFNISQTQGSCKIDTNSLIYELSGMKPKLPPTCPDDFKFKTLENLERLEKTQANGSGIQLTPLYLSKEIMKLELPWLKKQPRDISPERSKPCTTVNPPSPKPSQISAQSRPSTDKCSHMPDLVTDHHSISSTTARSSSSGYASMDEVKVIPLEDTTEIKPIPSYRSVHNVKLDSSPPALLPAQSNNTAPPPVIPAGMFIHQPIGLRQQVPVHPSLIHPNYVHPNFVHGAHQRHRYPQPLHQQSHAYHPTQSRNQCVQGMYTAGRPRPSPPLPRHRSPSPLPPIQPLPHLRSPGQAPSYQPLPHHRSPVKGGGRGHNLLSMLDQGGNQ